MPLDFGIHGFDFTRDLCGAIEAFTGHAVLRNPGAFRYRGMDLRPALERHLYVQCSNSAVLFGHYLALRCLPNMGLGAATGTALALPDALEAAVAAFFPGAGGMHTPPFSGHPSPARRARRLLGWLRSRLRPAHGTARVPASGPPILIHVVHAKFARYLLPVTANLSSGTYAYLAACDPELKPTLRQVGQPVVDSPQRGASVHGAFAPSHLFDLPHLMLQADQTLAALARLRPRTVAVVEGNAPLDAITAEACALLGIACYCVQQGWSPYLHNGFRRMAYTEMLVWGKRFAQLLASASPDQVFRVTGSHALQRPQDRDAPAATRRVFSFFLQAPCALLGKAAFDAFVDLIADVATAHPHISFVVREHPGYRLGAAAREALSSRSNLRFSDPARERLLEVLEQSELAASVFSTVLLEALALNVVPLVCSIGSMPRYSPDLASLGAAIEVHSIANARQAIDEIVADPERLLPMREKLPAVAAQFFAPGDAAQVIASILRVSD